MTTFWLITQYLLIFALIASSAAFLVAMFHPLRFDVKLRASIKGQRAEVWFVYLFRIFKIGVIATPHTQDIVLKLFFWKKLIERQQRTRPAAPPRPAPPADDLPDRPETPETPVSPVSANNETAPPPAPPQNEKPAAEAEAPAPPAEESSESVVSADYNATEIPEATQIINESPSSTLNDQAAAENIVKPVEVATTKDNQLEEAQVIPASEEKPSSDIRPPEIKPMDTTPLKPLSEVVEEKKPAEAETGQKKTEEPGKKDTSLRQKLRQFKRDLSRRFRQFQGYARIFRQKWRLLMPIGKRFWQRGKKGFGLIDPALKLRYALHEPYLTGMMQANMAVLSGFAGRFGLNFVPVPVFTEPGVYGRGAVSAVIRPWRLVIAGLGLLFEKQLYKELWQAFKWYRQRQKK